MNISKLTFFSAFVMTLAITFTVLLFEYIQKHYTGVSNLNLWFAVSVFIVFIICFVGVDSLFRFYGRKQVQRMAEKLPKQMMNEQKIGFKELSEKISGLNHTNDMMKQMETYRKEYIGNISHELRTPLFSIQGYVETLKDGAIEDIIVREKYLDRIGISVERLIAIVSDLDMINRFETGEIILNISDFEINQLIREVFDLLEIEAEKRNTKLILNTSQTKIYASADRQKIFQVFMNLISNAIHYANRKDAQVKVSTCILENKIHIEIEDNGMGIKPEVLPRIFERFYRVESSRTRRKGGSGLGLAIVKHILEAHNENISVKSEYLNGTKFSFLLNNTNFD